MPATGATLPTDGVNEALSNVDEVQTVSAVTRAQEVQEEPLAALSVPCETNLCLPPAGGEGQGQIHGTKWLDLDADSRRGDDEPPLAGVVVYLDLNNNGVRDQVPFRGAIASEPYDITDESGAFSFFELPANDYVVREEISDELTQTFPTDHLLVSTFKPSSIYQFEPATKRADLFATVNIERPLVGLAHSNADDRVYGVTDDGMLYVVEELRGATRAVGQLGLEGRLFNPVTIGEGDVAIDPNSIDFERQDYKATTYFVVGEGQEYEDQIFQAQLDYTDCFDESTDLLSCLPELSAASNLGTVFDSLALHDLSGVTVGSDGTVFVLAFDRSDLPVLVGFDPVNGQLFGPVVIPVDDTDLRAGGIDFDLSDNVIRGVLSGSSNAWYFTADVVESEMTVDLVVQRNQSDLQFIRTTAHRLFLGADEIIDGVDFGNFADASSSIHGVKWEDVNGNGRLDQNESLLPGWTIYLDLNANGQLDQDEPSHVTNDDPDTRIDETGQYWFTDLAPGEYTVAEVPQDGWTQTYPSYQSYWNFEGHEPETSYQTGETFQVTEDNGQSTTVTVTPFISDNGDEFGGNVMFDGGGRAGGSGHDIGLFSANLSFQFNQPINDASLLFGEYGGSSNLSINGEFVFANRLADLHDTVVGGVTVSVQYFDASRGMLQLNGAIETLAIGGQEMWIDRLCRQMEDIQDLPPATHVVSLASGVRVDDVNFGNQRRGEIHGRKWHDLNGNSEPDDGEYLAGWTIYLDLNGNGRLDAGEPSAVTDDEGRYSFTNLEDGTYTVGEVLQSGWEQTYPSTDQPSKDLFQFQDVDSSATYSFGAQFNTFADAGAVARITVGAFVQSGGNTTTDGTVSALELGAPVNQALSISNATAEFQFSETLTELVLVYSDSGGNVNLRVNGDLQNVGSLASLDGTLVGGTLVRVNQVTDNVGILTVSGEIASFAIGGQEFWIDNLIICGQPIPGSGVHVITVDGNDHRNVDFGNRREPPTIHGTKFHDLDGDGVRGPNDRGILSWEIYLDLNENGVYDQGEPLETTDQSGEYWFADLAPGRYVVREIELEGWTRTAPRATFTAQQHAAGELPVALASGDVDANGTVDLVVADPASSGLQLLLGSGNGDFDAPITLTTEAGPMDVLMVDVDNDDDLDVVASLPTADRLSIWLNSGDGTFAEGAFVATEKAPMAIVSGDFDGQNGSDIAVAYASSEKVTILLNDGSGEFSAPGGVVVDSPALDLATADFNHDGHLDLAVLAGVNRQISIFLNGSLEELSFDLATQLVVPQSSAKFSVSDFDQDGNLDFVTPGSVEGYTQVIFGLSSVTELTYDAGIALDGSLAPVAAAAGDLDGDGYPDLVTTDRGSDDLRIFFSQGDRTFTESQSYDVAPRALSVSVTDLNGDGALDIVTADTSTSLPGVTTLIQGPRDGYLVEINDGQRVHTGLDFGNFRNGRITGRKVHDPDCDGTLTGSESGLEGFTIYLDLNEDGIHDADEPFGVSDLNGDYEITNVPPGTYSVREVLFDDWVQSHPETGRHVVTLATSGQVIAGLNFGNFEYTLLPDGQDWMFGFDADDVMFGDNRVINNPCILSLGDDDHLLGHRGNDHLVGQLRNDTYYFESAIEVGVETDVVEESEDAGTNEHWDQGIHDRLHFDGVPEKFFDGVGPDEPVLIDISGASPVLLIANQVAEHTSVSGGTHVVVTELGQFEFIEQMVGGQSDDTLVGNSRNNLLDGRSGSDIQQGAAGDDTYVFVTGNPGDNDQLIETIGSDTLDFSRIPDPVTVDLATPPVLTTAPVIAQWGTPQQTVESLIPGLYENVIGTVEADTIRGSDVNNRLAGGDSNDVLNGLAGDDLLLGGNDDDQYLFDDGFGNDQVIELSSGGLSDVMDFTAVTVPLTFTIGNDIQVTDGLNTAWHDGLEVEKVLGGLSSGDTLISGDGDNIWVIDGVDTGTLNGVAFSGIENLEGGIGNDLFIFVAGGQLTGGIESGAGDDTFDFSQSGVVGGLIDGNTGDDSLIGNDDDRLWMITGMDAGSAAGIGNFIHVENLLAGSGIDTFTLAGGTLTGVANGGGNEDTLNADNVANVFKMTGPDEGYVTGMGGFVSVEHLVGNDLADEFEMGTGSVSGSIDGGIGADTLVAGDQPTLFTVNAPDAGSATDVSSFSNIENLTGGIHPDTFTLAGGTVSGAIDGQDGLDELVADEVANSFTLTGPNAGSATGVALGFTNLENITAGDLDDTLKINGGSLSGTFQAKDGTDSLRADDLSNTFGTIGPNSGFVNGLGLFVSVETLYGGSLPDLFVLYNGPFAGEIFGEGDNDSIAGFNMPTVFNITDSNSGDVDGTTVFESIENLIGGTNDDEFHVLGGTLTGVYDGGNGIDTLFAEDTSSTFEITGPDAGTLNGVAFTQIENLQGGSDPDQFVVNGGSLSGIADGGGGVDTLTADNTLNLFVVDSADGGSLGSVNRFASVESLVGNALNDIFWLAGGSLTGLIQGGLGVNSLIGNNVPGQYTIDNPNSGTVTGVSGGFDEIGWIYAGTDNDEITITSSGSLSGSVFAAGGDDTFLVTPGLGVVLDVDGGSGVDQLTVDAGAGLPTVTATQVTVTPGGAVVAYDDFENVVATCDVCLPPTPAVIAESPVLSPLPIAGDVNNDGVFDSSDLMTVFLAGEYENEVARDSTFAEGDWNGDGEFDSADLVLAFQSGNYRVRPNSEQNDIAAAIDLHFAEEVDEDDDSNEARFDL